MRIAAMENENIVGQKKQTNRRKFYFIDRIIQEA